MPDQVTLVSTTDSLEDVMRAMGQSVVTATPSADAAATESAVAEPPAETTTTPEGDETPAVPEPTTSGTPATPVKTKAQTRAEKIQEDINRATRQKYDEQRAVDRAREQRDRLEQEVRELAARAETLRRPAETTAPAVQTTPVEIGPEPKEDDFPTWQEYAKALAKHEAKAEAAQEIQQATQRISADFERKLNDRLAHQQLTQEQQQQQAQRAVWQQQYEARVSAARAAHADYEQVIAKEDIPISAPIRDVIFGGVNGIEVAYMLGSKPEVADVVDKLSQEGQITIPIRDALVRTKHAPEVLEYLAEHPDECRELAGLRDGLEVLTRMGQIAGTLAARAGQPAKPAVQPAPASRVAAPPSLVGTGRTSTTTPMDELDQQTYNRIRREQDAARRKIR